MAAPSPTSASPMFGPLMFANSPETEVPCPLCDDSFNLALRFDIFVKHLFEVHSLVVEDVQHIENLPEYLRVWGARFKAAPMEELVPAVRVGERRYFLLSALLQEDRELRHRLRLEHVLRVQELERSDAGFTRPCLFCKMNFEGSRCDFVRHLSAQHNLQLGNPQNLVFIEELVEKLDKKLCDLNCLFCDRTFPDRNTLKEHMRKKLHKCLNPKNKEYDRYFIKNYLEIDKKPKSDEGTANFVFLRDSNDDAEYYDWNEKEDMIICLFCDKRETNINTLCLHMEADHEFDFSELTKNFDFYQKVKFVNYVRKQAHNKKCFYCDLKCRNSKELQEHLFEEQHCKVPEIKIFDQPEYYFPTYENDAFLYLIDDVED